jgi:hypothetical protein
MGAEAEKAAENLNEAGTRSELLRAKSLDIGVMNCRSCGQSFVATTCRCEWTPTGKPVQKEWMPVSGEEMRELFSLGEKSLCDRLDELAQNRRRLKHDFNGPQWLNSGSDRLLYQSTTVVLIAERWAASKHKYELAAEESTLALLNTNQLLKDGWIHRVGTGPSAECLVGAIGREEIALYAASQKGRVFCASTKDRAHCYIIHTISDSRAKVAASEFDDKRYPSGASVAIHGLMLSTQVTGIARRGSVYRVLGDLPVPLNTAQMDADKRLTQYLLNPGYLDMIGAVTFEEALAYCRNDTARSALVTLEPRPEFILVEEHEK